MARDELDREDIISEATALVDRAAFRISPSSDEIVVGFRGDGSPSIYLTANRVYHFNPGGELRRAYLDETIFKAEHGRLVSMRRERTTQETALVRKELSEAETTAFLSSMRQGLAQFVTGLGTCGTTCTRQITSSATSAARQTAEARARGWLSSLPDQFTVARSAGIARSR